MNFVFLGPPGAGKGTISERVCVVRKIPHISTGDMFRAAIKAETPLGLEAKKIIDAGGLVSDEITVGLVKERLSQSDCQNGFILDGFPRTIFQAEALKSFSKIDAAVNFDIADEKILERLSNRRVCKNCGANYNLKSLKPKNEGICDKCGGELFTRDDDKIESIQNRLKIYRESTAPLIEFYKTLGILFCINAENAVEQVLKSFDSIFPV